MADDVRRAGDVDAATLARMRAAVIAGDANGQRVAALRRAEASVDRVREAMQAALTQADPATLDQTLNLMLVAQRRALEIPDGAGFMPRLQELAGAWAQRTMPEEQRRLYERSVTTYNIRQALQLTHPELTRPIPAPDPDDLRLFKAIAALGDGLNDAKARTIPALSLPNGSPNWKPSWSATPSFLRRRKRATRTAGCSAGGSDTAITRLGGDASSLGRCGARLRRSGTPRDIMAKRETRRTWRLRADTPRALRSR